jgi:hypothetical protein
MRKLTHAEFSQRIQERWTLVELIGEYQGGKNGIDYFCRDSACLSAGKVQNKSAEKLTRQGCSACGKAQGVRKRRKGYAESFSVAMRKFPHIELKSKYQQNREEVLYVCHDPKCPRSGERQSQIPATLKESGCKSCGIAKGRENKRKCNSVFRREIEERHPSIELMSKYQIGKSDIRFICHKSTCPLAGKEQSQKAEKLKSRGCKSCGNLRGYKLRTKTNEDFYREHAERNAKPDVLFPLVSKEEYQGATTKIEFECVRCGKKCYKTPHKVLAQEGRPNCPSCMRGLQTSFTELCFFKALEVALGEREVEHKNRDAIGLELDIFAPNKQLALEPGTWYRHQEESTFFRDKEKQKRCKKQGIKLLTIYYTYQQDTVPFGKGCIIPKGLQLSNSQIENLFSYDCVCYEDKLPNDAQMQQLIGAILTKTLNKKFVLDDDLWDVIKRRAQHSVDNGHL